jgi:RNA polymerase sigma-70 factor (ECF subfamily)
VERVRDAVAKLPPLQQAVIGLRDVEGFSPAEVAAALDLSPVSERVLLHRARSRVRRELEEYFDQ